jgi:hypothetical protein
MGRRKPHPKEKVYLNVKKFQPVAPKRDFLKYYRVVRHWAKKKYGLSGPDLEMLYFLKGEHLFSTKTFEKYNNIFPWDEGRFKRLKRDGWITKWRTEGMDKNRWALYTVSVKGKRAITSIYKKLNGEEDFSMVPSKNPVLKKTAGFVDKTIAMQMKEINKENRELRLIAVAQRRDKKR